MASGKAGGASTSFTVNVVYSIYITIPYTRYIGSTLNELTPLFGDLTLIIHDER